jgi:hypothetical protein
MTRRLRTTLQLSLCFSAALLGLAGCGHFIPGMGGNNQAQLIFTNESIDQADVYAVIAAGDPVRVGSVIAGRTDTLPLNSTVVGASSGVNIVARVLAASRRPSTGQITVHSGDVLQVRLPADETTLIVLPGRQ